MRVDGQNSLLETFNMNVGTTGTGTLTLTNNGTLNVEGGEVYLGVFEPAVGTLNIDVPKFDGVQRGAERSL